MPIRSLRLGMPPTGLRTYLAVRGGIDVAPVLGSRSTDTLPGIGPPPLQAGDVLPVGGIQEKVIAAKRTGLRELILPEANRGDFEELQEPIREGMTVHFVARYPEVEAVVFHKAG